MPGEGASDMVLYRLHIGRVSPLRLCETSPRKLRDSPAPSRRIPTGHIDDHDLKRIDATTQVFSPDVPLCYTALKMAIACLSGQELPSHRRTLWLYAFRSEEHTSELQLPMYLV